MTGRLITNDNVIEFNDVIRVEVDYQDNVIVYSEAGDDIIHSLSTDDGEDKYVIEGD